MSQVSFVLQRYDLYNLLNRYFELKYIPKTTAQTINKIKFIMKSLINSQLPKKKTTKSQSLPLFRNLQSQLVQFAPRLSRLLLARAATCLEKLKIGKSSNLQFCVSAAHICPQDPRRGRERDGEEEEKSSNTRLLLFLFSPVLQCLNAFLLRFFPF